MPSKTVVSASELQAQIWVTNFLSKTSGVDLYKKVIYLKMLAAMYRQNPALTSDDAIKYIVEQNNALEQDPDYEKLSYESLDTVMGPLLSLLTKLAPGRSGPVKEVAGDVIKDLYAKLSGKAIGEYVDPRRRVDEITHNASLRARVDKSLREALTEVVAASRNSTAMRSAIDSVLGPSLRASISDAANIILDNNPDVEAFVGIGELITANGELQYDIAELRALAERNFTEILGQLSDANEKLDGLIVSQDFLVNGVGTLLKAEAERARIEAEAKRKQAILKDLAAGAYLLGTLASVIDPKLGKQVIAASNAAITIADSVLSFFQLVNKSGFVDALFSAGTLALTGGVVQAVLSMVSAFVDAGPTPDQQILMQLEAVQKQIDALGAHLDRRFDRVERQIQKLLAQCQEGFEKVLIELNKINRNLNLIQAELLDLRKQIIAAESNILGALRSASQRELDLEIRASISYKERTNDDITEPGFNDAAATFYNWVVAGAYGVDIVQPVNRPTALETLSDVLVIADPGLPNIPPSIWGDLNFLKLISLNAWAPAKNLPDIDVFVRAAQAYMELFIDWPAYAADYTRAEAVAMLDDARSTWLTLSEMRQGPLGNGLYDRLVSQYADAHDRWTSALGVRLISLAPENRPNPFDDRQSLQPAGPSWFNGLEESTRLMDIEAGGSLGANLSPNGIQEIMFPPPFAHAWLYSEQVRLLSNIQITKTNVDRTTTPWTYTYRIAGAISSQLFEPGNAFWQTIQVRRADLELESQDRNPWLDGAAEAFLAASVLDSSNQALMNATQSRFDALLKPFRPELIETLIQETQIPASDLATLAARCDGAVAALKAFVFAGLPRSLQRDDRLRSQLLGRNRLLDQVLTIGLLREQASDVGVIDMVQQEARVRHTEFVQRINEALDFIRVNEYEEGPEHLLTAIKRLEVFTS